ncbi:MAG: (d)CMP kinase [Acholeplasmataceae bacterium]|nr:(d)CMP kinase [Acholeplasmataceae bacterium]
MPGYKLAIDGPAGSGKSTISSLIAKKLGWTHIDTGAMYRAVTLQAIELGINLNDEGSYRFLETSKIHYDFDRIYINDRDVTEGIRSEGVTNNVSLVSSFPYVRKKLVELQKMAAENGNIVMDGRDIGTVVLPKADLKIFLTANVEERAKRRYKEHLKKGKETHLSKVIEDIVNRDQKDSTRKESPLRIADDAIVLDTTYLTIDEVVNKIIELTDKKEN